MEEECPILECKGKQPYQSQDKPKYPQSAELHFWEPPKDSLSRFPKARGKSRTLPLTTKSVSISEHTIKIYQSVSLSSHLVGTQTSSQPIYVSIYIVICFHLYLCFLLSVMSFHTTDHTIFSQQKKLSCYCFLPFHIPYWYHVYMDVQFLFLTFKPTNFSRSSWMESCWPWCSELGGPARWMAFPHSRAYFPQGIQSNYCSLTFAEPYWGRQWRVSLTFQKT